MKKLIHVALLLLVAAAASAATYTITTTAAQETKLTRYRTILNASGAGYASNNAMVMDLCTTKLTDGIRNVDDTFATSLADKARNASSTEQTNACTQMGGTVVNERCQ